MEEDNIDWGKSPKSKEENFEWENKIDTSSKETEEVSIKEKFKKFEGFFMEKLHKHKKLLLKLIILGSYLILAIGLVVFVLVFFLNWTAPGFLITIAFCSLSNTLPFIYIVPTIVVLKYHLSKKGKRIKLIVVGICGLLVVTSLMPTFAVSSTIASAESQFKDVYGNSYLKLDTKGMLPEPYSAYKNFNVVPDDSEITIKVDEEFLDNGKDKFHFDYYAPKNIDDNDKLPVIIKLHGGAWILGNKGPIFNVPLSKYLARQGYVTFDVEYGLYDFEKAAKAADLESLANILQPLIDASPEMKERVLPDYKGNYMIQDQVAIIGAFTYFLAENAKDYNADLDNVFLMGSSAGAHMAGVVGAGYKSPKFNLTFSQDLTLRGIILFYPPTDLIKMRDAMADGRLGGIPNLAKGFNAMIDDGDMSDSELKKEYEKYSAAYLIQDDDVKIAPILQFHGMSDNLVPYQEQGVDFKKIADKEDRTCILLSFPFTGHGFDIMNAQSYAWQVSTYYTERFLALEVSD